MVYIPPGTFMMGSDPNEPERGSDETLHQVTLTKGFYIGVTEVTQGQWQAVMGSNPAYFQGTDTCDGNCPDDCPVERVSWDDCQAFIAELNRIEDTDRFRLPTEAEWEYACRAGTTTPFSFGNCLSTDQANYDGYSPYTGCPSGIYRKKTTPVGSFPPNAWGIYDMHGNLWEWCQDWYGAYPGGAVTDPAGPGGGLYRVFRGGGWSFVARLCRSAYRGYNYPENCFDSVGFRLSMTP